MKKVLYLKSNPIQHPGEFGGELPLEPSPLFNELDAEHLFLSATHMENYFHNIFRSESLNDAYKELFDVCKDIKGPDRRRDALIIRRVRSYILEVDIFLKHWEKYLGHKGHAFKTKFKTITSETYDSNEAYALISALRNYLVHSDDVTHGQHIGIGEFKIWADRDILIKDGKLSGTGKQTVLKQEKRIDLLDVIQKSLPAVNQVHSKLMDCLIDKELESDCKYLIEASKRTVLINAKAWFVFNYTGYENINMPYIIGGVPGMGADYVQLNWQGYEAVWGRIQAHLKDN